MRALSIQQPWAWAIFALDKDVENRTWRTALRGRILIHAGKGFDEDGASFIRDALGHALPPRFDRGGFIGSAVLADCVDASASAWFFGPVGFVLQDIRPCRFTPWRGALGLFEVPDEIARALVGEAAE